MQTMEQSKVLALGMLRYDLISWWATDALLEDGFDSNPLVGWLVSPEAGSEGDIYDAEPSEFQMYVSGLWGVALGLVGCDGSVWVIRGMEVEQIEPPARQERCVDPWREKPFDR